MNVIRNSNNEVLGFLGGSQKKVKGFKYRFNKFIIKTEYEDEFIWYNVFTGSIVSIRDYEADNIFTEDYCNYADYLIQNYFLVPENFDEESLLTEYRKRKTVPITANCLTRLNNFTILTTTKCNARCFYCYQLHGKHKEHMTVETAHKVAKYIINSTFEGQQVFLGWFGGEPLYNPKVIDIITTKVESANREVHSSISTNGYLMDEKLCKKAIQDWKISNVQVTIDGPEEIYNKTKNFIYKDTNAFKKIISNIHNMLKSGLYVSIRINVDSHNEDSLKDLLLFLAEEFKNEGHFSVYIHELFDDSKTPEHSKKLFANMMELNDLITKLNLRTQGANVPDTIKSIHCMVDDDRSVVIMPNGQLGVCEHYENEHFVGHIDNPTDIDIEEVKSWREMSEFEEICSDCPYKPACLKCKLCPDYKICDIYEKEYMIHRTKEDLKKIYEDYNKDQNREPKKCECK